MDIRTTLYSIALFFAAASGQLLVAQEVPNIVPPSPEAASVFKFTEVPVSFYTGVPNITVPIYEIEARGLTIPINLSYHSRGIQVSEIASRVGLGWAFNYGGMISKQVRGIEDHNGQYGFLNVDSNSEDFFTDEDARRDLGAMNNISQHDHTPDQYYFNANGINGKFILDRFDGGKPLIQHSSDIKIVDTGASWNLTDSNGNRYFYMDTEHEQIIQSFEASEYYQNYHVTSTDLPAPHISTWLISKIITAQNDTINYIYETPKENTQFYRRSHDAKQRVIDPLAPQNGSTPIAGDHHSCLFSKVSGYNSRLQRINFSKGYILFNYEPREDLYGSGCLKNVKVYNKSNNKVKEMNFGYEYTTDPYDPNHFSINQYLNGFDDDARKRLFLKSVQVLDNSSSEAIPLYQFEYDSIPLPNRHSNSQDFWGYYNGRNNGQYLKALDTNWENTATNDNRSVSDTLSQAGMLKKIINPDGGSVSFTYEHNKVKNYTYPSYLIPNNINPTSKRHAYLGLLDTIYHTANGIFIMPFTVGDNLIDYIKTDIDLFGNDSGCGTSPDNHTNSQCRFIINIYKNGQIHRTLFKGINQIALEPGEYQLRVKVIPISGPFDLLDVQNNSFNIHLSWIEQEAQNDSLIYGPGKRIKKIAYRDSLNNLSGLSKSYSYIDPATSQTSGHLIGLTNFYARRLVTEPNFPSTMELYGNVPGSPLSTFQGNGIGYGMVTEFYEENGNAISKTEYKFSMIDDGGTYYHFPYHPPTDNEWLRGKELITKFYKKEGLTFKKIKEIENRYVYGDSIMLNPDTDGTDPLDVVSTPAAFTPFIPVTSSQMTRPIGVDFDHPDVFYKKTRTYFNMPLTLITTYRTLVDQNGPTTIDGPPPSNDWDPPIFEQELGYKTYFLNGGTVDLLSRIVTEYFDDGTKFKTRTNYDYLYSSHYNLSLAKEDLGPNLLRTTKHFYANDLQTNPPTVTNQMVSKNMVGIPLRTEISQNSGLNLGVRLSTQETNFKNWGNDFLAPEIIRASKGTAVPEIRIKYNAVDNTTGNPLEVEKESGTKISYVWGHNKTLPMAKIENMAYASIPSSRITAVINASNAIPYVEANMLTALENLRTDAALANAMVTTYTYKPLVGVTSITGPNGDKITYHYDTFNRLQYVKDKEGKILSENQYYYRTQN